MRSLGYILFGTPSNLDDCLDYSLKEKPEGVSLELEYYKKLRGPALHEYFLGEYSWTFPSRSVSYSETYGTLQISWYHVLAVPCDIDEQLDSINSKLAAVLKKIEETGVIVEGSDARFHFGSKRERHNSQLQKPPRSMSRKIQRGWIK